MAMPNLARVTREQAGALVTIDLQGKLVGVRRFPEALSGLAPRRPVSGMPRSSFANRANRPTDPSAVHGVADEPLQNRFHIRVTADVYRQLWRQRTNDQTYIFHSHPWR